jgi:serine protease inhibitor
MYALDKFAFGESADCQVLSMPYQGDEALSMIVVLPKDRYGLADFEKNLTGAKLMQLIQQTRVQKVLVRLLEMFCRRFRQINTYILGKYTEVLFGEGVLIVERVKIDGN